jgi:hypothetical protein
MLSIIIDVLEFFSFWLVAPEFLGERRLKSIESIILKSEQFLPGVTLGFSGLFIGLFFGRYSKNLEFLPGWNIFVLVFTFFLMVAYVFFHKQIGEFLARRVFGPVFLRLSENGQTRNLLLKSGIGFFCLSFLLKMVSHIYF